MKKGLGLILWLFAGTLALVSCSNKPVGNGDENPWTHVKSLADIKGKKIALLGGSVHESYMMDHYPEAKLMRFGSVAELIAAVDNGVSDFMMIDNTCLIGSGIEKKKVVHCFTDTLLSGEYGIAFRHEDTELCDKMNHFLAQIEANGTMADMKRRWIDGDGMHVEMPHFDLSGNRKTLVVGTLPTFPFVFIKDGKNVGFEVELLERFAQYAGYNVEFDIYEFSALVAALVSGRIDVIISCMNITEERSKQVLFSNPYFHSETECFGHVDKGSETAAKGGMNLMESIENNLIVEQRWKLLLDGFYETIFIFIFSLLLGTLIGGIICWMRMSRTRWLQTVAKVYVEIMRGMPILVFLMIMFYIIFASSGVEARWVAVMAFSINFGAFVSEMFRTGIEGVDRGQTEAGLAMGFSPVATFFNFIVPQALKSIIPVYKGEAISLIKSTSIVGYIAIQDLTKVSDIIRSRTFDAFFPLILISIIYFILAWLLGKALDYLANKTK